MERTFLYHAHATGVSGRITLPFDEIIPVQAPAAIPVTGGYSATRVENFRYRDILSFRSATSVVSGDFSVKNQAYETLMSASVEGLNILGVVTADVMVARLTSRHPKDGSEPSIIPLGSYFENLRIAGCKVDAPLNTEQFTRCAQYHEVRRTINEDPDVRARLSHGFADVAAQPPNCALLCSLAGPVSVNCRDLKPDGHAIHVEHFGTVYLAEFLILPYSRSITMLRVELGSSVEGHISSGGGSGNGQPYPPT
jgi:hypothetical protein